MAETAIGRFRRLVREGTLRDDDAQRAAAEKLQALQTRLAGTRTAGALERWFRRRPAEPGSGGLYLYGDVGRGKSMLMDIFFDTAPVAEKRRVHFHAFMQDIHAGIRAARDRRESDPVQKVAAKLAKRLRLLCFDEFQVDNITDAMILGPLFEALLDAGATIVLTANLPPEEQYRDGLNRALFLPFVDLLQARLDLHHLESPRDHRLGEAREEVYFRPLDAESAAAMDAAWQRCSGGENEPLVLTVQGRAVAIPRSSGRTARIDFEALCGTPRGPADYLAIAERFDALFIDNIPRLPPERQDAARRFVILVDALYEAGRLLFCSADAEPEELYVKGRGRREFARTASRLHEMSSPGWPEAKPAPRPDRRSVRRARRRTRPDTAAAD